MGGGGTGSISDKFQTIKDREEGCGFDFFIKQKRKKKRNHGGYCKNK